MRQGVAERLMLRPLEMADAARIQELFPGQKRGENVAFLMKKRPSRPKRGAKSGVSGY
jgi:hypothetical protein